MAAVVIIGHFRTALAAMREPVAQFSQEGDLFSDRAKILPHHPNGCFLDTFCGNALNKTVNCQITDRG
jgi:hypothetical protein